MDKDKIAHLASFDSPSPGKMTPNKKMTALTQAKRMKQQKRTSILDEILEEEENRAQDPFDNRESKLIDGTHWLICSVRETEAAV